MSATLHNCSGPKPSCIVGLSSNSTSSEGKEQHTTPIIFKKSIKMVELQARPSRPRARLLPLLQHDQAVQWHRLLLGGPSHLLVPGRTNKYSLNLRQNYQQMQNIKESFLKGHWMYFHDSSFQNKSIISHILTKNNCYSQVTSHLMIT